MDAPKKRPRKYAPKLTLYPMKFEDVVKAIASVKTKPGKPKRTKSSKAEPAHSS